MGRINLTSLRVRRRALQNLETRRTTIRPNWLDIVGDIPPSQVLIRPQKLMHPVLQVRTKTIPPPPHASADSTPTTQQIITTSDPQPKPNREVRKPLKPKLKSKASRLFCPLPIHYEEDTLRRQFYSDHPWELARPRLLLETTGNQHSRADWSTGLLQPGIPLSGESVIQRQLHLLSTVPDITIPQAYDIARHEFYDLRRQQDIRRRIAAEEAEHAGAYWGPTPLQWGMHIENTMYDDWERWSRETVVGQIQRNAAFAGETMGVEEESLEGNTAVEEDGRAGGVGGTRRGPGRGVGVGANAVSGVVSGPGLSGRDAARAQRGRQVIE